MEEYTEGTNHDNRYLPHRVRVPAMPTQNRPPAKHLFCNATRHVLNGKDGKKRLSRCAEAISGDAQQRDHSAFQVRDFGFLSRLVSYFLPLRYHFSALVGFQ
jgi:hypothetical protein